MSDTDTPTPIPNGEAIIPNEEVSASAAADSGDLTLSRPGEQVPKTRRIKRSVPEPTDRKGIPAGLNGRLRVVHN